ncbi:DUF3139 domain-containing protein [Lederbergia sp. NSJ-179]|uniref:DUF3139 domain-containing protein n=1 Tax=Lederbergia sp. NSJ-179 TaxID=2931402 RepID=UPI001FD4FE99|nr:DUF3139 domain-containing protein [Lederbergia sp. NSJ-179]MCJ7841417.1 DUF3139 domain-containing protein [Lederbergia sp. NSJ-179]
MKKKVLWISLSLIMLIIVTIPLGFFYVLNNGNPYTKYIADKNVPVYLEEKGYTENEIEESHYVEPKYLINNDYYHGHYMVIFKDEPDTTYYYGITKKGKQVKQFCEKDRLSPDGVTDIVKTETKHSEKKCVHSLENRD